MVTATGFLPRIQPEDCVGCHGTKLRFNRDCRLERCWVCSDEDLNGSAITNFELAVVNDNKRLQKKVSKLKMDLALTWGLILLLALGLIVV